MLRPQTKITITTKLKTIVFDFANKYEFQDGWGTLTSTGKVTLPKNIYAVDKSNKKRFPMFGKNIGGFGNKEPILKRGDKIKIESNYIYYDKNLNQKSTPVVTVADGYISKVGSKVPIEIEFEDNMYLLKQIAMKNQAYPLGTSIESIMTDVLIGTGLTVNNLTETNATYNNCLLTSENETAAQFLAKMKKDMNISAYFRGKELRIGSIIYFDDIANSKTFQFQETIISSDLVYSRKDDIVVSCVASNHIEQNTGSKTKDGANKTKKVRLEVLVTLKNNIVITRVIKKGDKPEENTDGQRMTFPFPEAKTIDELIKLATVQLKRYYYDGFKGSFTTFGTPYVQFGDNANIVNDVLPEQNGIYKIKAVEYTGGVDGTRQKIILDYKLKVDE